MVVKINIAIDGPAAAGKSTISKKVAEHLNYVYIDTGAMYRAVTLYTLRNGMDVLEDLSQLSVRLTPLPNQRVYMNDEDVTEEIRTMEVNQNVSRVSSYQVVREYLVSMQRAIAKDKGVVMDGRDIGTTVLPDSELKIYMNASPEVRAERRFIEEQQKGVEIDIRTLTEQIKNRDEQDKTRELSPLRKADDALFLDTSYMSIEEVTQKIIELAEETVRGER